MGLHEYSQDVHGTKKADNRVHIEVFSIEEPPEFFLKSLSAKNAETHDFTLVNGPEINGVSDTGALDDTNLLFKEIATKITKVAAGESPANFSLYTPKSIKTHLESKREDFEKLIVKHPSEWYDLSDDHMFNSILAAGLRTLEDKVITRFMSRDEYDNSSYKTLLLEAHDLLVDHEKERIDQLAWIQEASALEMPKELWYFWPLALNTINCYCHRNFTVDEVKLIVKKLRRHEKIKSVDLFDESNCSLQSSDKNYLRFTELLNSCFRTYEINTCIRKIQFIAQIYHETDRFRTTTEYNATQKEYSPYYGRGLMQLTHESNYRNYEAYCGNDIISNIEVICDELSYAIDSAGWFWSEGKVLSTSTTWKPSSRSRIVGRYSSVISITKKIISIVRPNGRTVKYGTFSFNKLADDDYTNVISYLVNGGSNGLQERSEYVSILKDIFKYNDCNNNK